MTDIFHNAHRYGDLDSWRAEARALHDVAPIHRIEDDRFRPFWAVIGHDQIMEIERNTELFTNGPEPVLQPDSAIAERLATGVSIRTLIHMDAPDHTKYRRLTNDWFKPAGLNRLQSRLDDLSNEAVQTLRDSGGEIEFNTKIAVPYPLQVILAILGLPREDYPRMLKLTQELFGATDPDLGRPAETPEERVQVLLDFYAYFSELTATRRDEPTGDLASLIANGRIDDEPMPDLETMGYYTIVATAGHDTTAASIAEGMHELARHPDQLELLRRDPSLIANAVEEMIRLASPVRHFMRTAQRDTEIGGQKIMAGDWLMLNYTAANLDPSHFDEPLRFDVTRHNANRHIAFGFGAHFCLGAQLARLELRSLFSALVHAFDTVEPAGERTTAKTTFVSGPKAVPIRYTLR